VLSLRLASLAPEVAEVFATFALVLAGCGAIVANQLTGAPGALGVALAFAAVIAVMVYATGHLSGAHINPAVTVAFAAIGHFPWRRVPSYIVAQLAGALAAAGLLRVWFGATADLGATGLAASVDPISGLAIEIVATAFLAFVIASVATDARAQEPAAGLAIGAAVGLGALFAGPLTGGSMNPARTLGPALVTGKLASLWLYIVGPLVGATLAMGLYEAIRHAEVPEPDSADDSDTSTPTPEATR